MLLEALLIFNINSLVPNLPDLTRILDYIQSIDRASLQIALTKSSPSFLGLKLDDSQETQGYLE